MPLLQVENMAFARLRFSMEGSKHVVELLSAESGSDKDLYLSFADKQETEVR